MKKYLVILMAFFLIFGASSTALAHGDHHDDSKNGYHDNYKKNKDRDWKNKDRHDRDHNNGYKDKDRYDRDHGKNKHDYDKKHKGFFKVGKYYLKDGYYYVKHKGDFYKVGKYYYKKGKFFLYPFKKDHKKYDHH